MKTNGAIINAIEYAMAAHHSKRKTYICRITNKAKITTSQTATYTLVAFTPPNDRHCAATIPFISLHIFDILYGFTDQ